ncbi:outer membrane usher protein [Providencia alcalifaciens]|nr:outer membrane usher protein [Providencia alcalifaciens]
MSSVFAEESGIPAIFDSSPLKGSVDVSQFAYGNPVTEGVHRIEIYLNDEWKGKTDVEFKKIKNNTASPCYTIKLIEMIGLSTESLDKSVKEDLTNSEQCVLLGTLFPGVNATYDYSLQRLNVTAPQIMVNENARGYVSPDNWDDGIIASALSYYYNVYGTKSDYSDSLEQYLSLQGRINLHSWRLYLNGNYSKSKGNSPHFKRSSTYLEKAIISLKSNLTLGESSTSDNIFGGINFTGIKLSSDQRMYPDSKQGFAPTVRGVANSTALVTISQRGNLVYQTTVPPGPFVINGLYPTGSNGDLLVSIREADGTEREFTVTYASTSELMRPGMTNYSLTAGKYRNNNNSLYDNFILGTLSHGVNNILTIFGGGVGSNRYGAVASGMALNTPFGAFSSDITFSQTKFRNIDNQNGHSIKFSYSKILPVVETNITLASYRYSSSGYYSPNEAFLLLDLENNNNIVPLLVNNFTKRKNRFEVNASQSLPEGYGSLSLNASAQDYWNRSGSDMQYQASYYNNYDSLTYGINLARIYNTQRKDWENQISLTLSLPLGRESYSPTLSTNYSHNRDSNSVQTSLTGSAGENNQFTYNTYVNNDHQKSNNNFTGGVGGRWSAPLASLGGDVSKGSGYTQYSGNISGGIVAYQNGIILTPMLNDMIGIIEAKNAS